MTKIKLKVVKSLKVKLRAKPTLVPLKVKTTKVKKLKVKPTLIPVKNLFPEKKK